MYFTGQLPTLTPSLLLFLPAVHAAIRPHILMMLADDWGSYDSSARARSLGRKPDVQTPVIDQLSSDHHGITFANYYVQPICSPTRASLMSGRYSIHTGSEHRLFGFGEPSCLPTTTPLMPRAFNELGYASHMIGKWVRRPALIPRPLGHIRESYQHASCIAVP